MPTLPTPMTPYYGGGQVQNPANVIPTVGEPSNKLTEDKVGTLAVDNAAATIYGLASKSGGVDTWVEMGSSSPLSAFPITPYVVGPVDKAGFQTIQSAITAANAGGGGMVYIQPGIYTENLSIPLGVSLCNIEPQNYAAEVQPSVTITGSHTLVLGGTSSRIFSARGIYFHATPTIFTSALTTNLQVAIEDCYLRATGGFIFAVPNIANPSDFSITTTKVLDGEVFSVDYSGTLLITDSALALTIGHQMTIIGAADVTFLRSSFVNPIVISTGLLDARDCDFEELVTVGGGDGSAGAAFTACTFEGGSDPCISMGTAGSITLVDCTINTSNVLAIEGTSAGDLNISLCNFIDSSGIDPGLTGVVIASTLSIEALQTHPSAGIAFPITFGTPVQNTLGDDIIVSGSINVTGGAGTVQAGIDRSNTPAVTDISQTIAAATVVYFSLCVPHNYWMVLSGTGTVAVDSVVAIATHI